MAVPDWNGEPTGVYADPLERDSIERELVPASDRAHEKYSGYSLSIKTESLNRQFRLVSDAQAATQTIRPLRPTSGVDDTSGAE